MRKILIAVQTAVIFFSSFLLFVTLAYKELTTAMPFYFVMFLVGIARGFYGPAQFSLMTQLITRETYANSSAWNSTFWHIAVVIGSSVGGLMMGFLGKTITYCTVLTLIILAFIQLLRIAPRPF